MQLLPHPALSELDGQLQSALAALHRQHAERDTERVAWRERYSSLERRCDEKVDELRRAGQRMEVLLRRAVEERRASLLLQQPPQHDELTTTATAAVRGDNLPGDRHRVAFIREMQDAATSPMARVQATDATSHDDVVSFFSSAHPAPSDEMSSAFLLAVLAASHLEKIPPHHAQRGRIALVDHRGFWRWHRVRRGPADTEKHTADLWMGGRGADGRALRETLMGSTQSMDSLSSNALTPSLWWPAAAWSVLSPTTLSPEHRDECLVHHPVSLLHCFSKCITVVETREWTASSSSPEFALARLRVSIADWHTNGLFFDGGSVPEFGAQSVGSAEARHRAVVVLTLHPQVYLLITGSARLGGAGVGSSDLMIRVGRVVDVDLDSAGGSGTCSRQCSRRDVVHEWVSAATLITEVARLMSRPHYFQGDCTGEEVSLGSLRYDVLASFSCPSSIVPQEHLSFEALVNPLSGMVSVGLWPSSQGGSEEAAVEIIHATVDVLDALYQVDGDDDDDGCDEDSGLEDGTGSLLLHRCRYIATCIPRGRCGYALMCKELCATSTLPSASTIWPGVDPLSGNGVGAATTRSTIQVTVTLHCRRRELSNGGPAYVTLAPLNDSGTNHTEPGSCVLEEEKGRWWRRDHIRWQLSCGPVLSHIAAGMAALASPSFPLATFSLLVPMPHTTTGGTERRNTSLPRLVAPSAERRSPHPSSTSVDATAEELSAWLDAWSTALNELFARKADCFTSAVLSLQMWQRRDVLTYCWPGTHFQEREAELLLRNAELEATTRDALLEVQRLSALHARLVAGYDKRLSSRTEK